MVYVLFAILLIYFFLYICNYLSDIDKVIEYGGWIFNTIVFLLLYVTELVLIDEEIKGFFIFLTVPIIWLGIYYCFTAIKNNKYEYKCNEIAKKARVEEKLLQDKKEKKEKNREKIIQKYKWKAEVKKRKNSKRTKVYDKKLWEEFFRNEKLKKSELCTEWTKMFSLISKPKNEE